MTIHTLLHDAAQLLRKATANLDTRSNECPSCGLTKRENWTEHQTAIELEAMIKKLERMAQSVQSGAKGNSHGNRHGHIDKKSSEG